MIASLENAVPNKRAPAMERRPKFQGILKKLMTYKLLCLVAAYVDVLENKATFSLIFEKDFLMPHEKYPAVENSLFHLEDLSTEELDYTSNNYF